MTKYVFIVMSICQIGGAEQYIYNKSKYLESIGYEVHIFSGLKREIAIPGLKKYQSECLPCVMFLPSTFSKRERNKNADIMLHSIAAKKGEKIIIESNGIAEALWGEMLAEKLKAKHLYIDICEYYNFDKERRQFVRFKMDRKELYGITESSVSKMLGEETNYKEHINAACNNVVDDCDYPEIDNIPLKDHYTIGYIGRLEKSCVPRIIDGIKETIIKHPEKTFNLLFIGTKDNKNVSYIDHIMSGYKNVSVFFTDSLYPIPRKLIHSVNVFVSTAGSAFVTYYDSIPTVIVHPVEGYALGIMGEDFFIGDNMYRNESKYSVCDEIERIMNNEASITFDESILKNYNNEMVLEFKRQLGFVLLNNSIEYYPYLLIKPSTKREKLYSIFGKILGANILFKIVESYRKLYS